MQPGQQENMWTFTILSLESLTESQQRYLSCLDSRFPGCCCCKKALEWWTVRLGKTKVWPAPSCEWGTGGTQRCLHLWRWRVADLTGGEVRLAHMDFSSEWAQLQQAQQRHNLVRRTHEVSSSHQSLNYSDFRISQSLTCESSQTPLEIRMHVTLRIKRQESPHLMDLVHLLNIHLLSTYYVPSLGP